MRRRPTVLAALAAIAAVLSWLLWPSPPDGKPDPGSASRPGTPARVPTGPTSLPSPPPVAVPPVPEATPPAAAPAPAPEQDLFRWGPRGRVVDRETREQVPWTAVCFQMRISGSLRGVVDSTESRDSPEDGEESGKEPGAFDFLPGRRTSPSSFHGTAADLRSAEFRVVARAPGYRKGASEWIRLSGGPPTEELIVPLESDVPATLVATALHEDGTPFRGGVLLSLDDGEEIESRAASGMTDEAGRIRLEGLRSGRFDVTLEFEGPEKDVCRVGVTCSFKQLDLPPGGSAEVKARVPASGEIAIDATSGDRALPGALRIGLRFAGGQSQFSGDRRRIVGVPPGPAELSVSTDGYRVWTTTVLVEKGKTARVEARLEKE